MKKISVVVPVYKVEDYLARAVRSLQQQTHENFEIILVDDGSPDRCGAMCDSFAAEDSRIRVIHKPNGGLSDARNAGMDAAAGEYIAFMDSDDWFDPSMLSTLYRLCEERDADIAECSYRSWYESRVEAESPCSGEIMEFTPMEAIECNLDWSWCRSVVWNKLYRSHVCRGIRFPVGKLHEDEFTTHLFYMAANKIVYADAALVNYERRNMGSITASFKLKNLDGVEAYRQKLLLLSQTPGYEALLPKLANTYCWVLLDRMEKCEAAGLTGPEREDAEKNALALLPQLRRFGAMPDYLKKIRELEKHRDKGEG